MTGYDLEERTALFGEFVIDFCKKASQNAVSKPIINCNELALIFGKIVSTFGNKMKSC